METHVRKPGLSSQPALSSSAAKTQSRVPEQEDEPLSLQPGADIASLSTKNILALGRVIGNHALQRLISNSQAPSVTPTQPQIQRLLWKDIIQADQYIITQIAENKKWTDNLPELVTWANTSAQIRSIMENRTYKEWTAIKAVFPNAADLPNKTAGILKRLEEKKAEIAAQQIILFRNDFTKGMGMAEANKLGIVTIQHTSTFRTEDDKLGKKGSATGPATREWHATVAGQAANWVLHIHYNDVTQNSVPAAHVKPWATRFLKDSKRFNSPTLMKMAVVASAVDKASNDLTDHEKKFL